MRDLRPTWLSKHLQEHHTASLAMDLEPGFCVRNEHVWSAYHDHLHRQPEADHYHPERTEDVDQQIWVAFEEGTPLIAAKSKEQCGELVSRMDYGTELEVQEVTLKSDLYPAVYGGPTLLEALWSEMDTLMERMMTGQSAEDGRDPGRAEMLGWVLAIVTNGYRPDINAIRKEAMRRFREGQ